MNVNIKRFLAVSAVALALPLAAPVSAEPFFVDDFGGRHKMGKHAKHGKIRWETLNLTQQQQDRIYAIRHNADPQFREKKRALQQLKEQMFELRQKDNYTLEELTNLQKRISAARSEIELLRVETDYAIFNVLTPEQKTKARESRKEPRKEGRKGDRRKANGRQPAPNAAPADPWDPWGAPPAWGQAPAAGDPMNDFLPPWLQNQPNAAEGTPAGDPFLPPWLQGLPDAPATPITPAPAPEPTESTWLPDAPKATPAPAADAKPAKPLAPAESVKPPLPVKPAANATAS